MFRLLLTFVVLLLPACSPIDEGHRASVVACQVALSKGAIHPPMNKVDLHFSYSNKAPPTYYKMNQWEYRDQSIAPYFDFGFNNVDDPGVASFTVVAVASLEDLLPEPDENTLYSNEACVLFVKEGRITFRFHSASIATRPNLAGRCKGSYMLYFIGVSPTLADSLVVLNQEGRQLVDAGNWDVVVQDLGEDRVSVGMNRGGPFLGCLLDGLIVQQEQSAE